jgi:subtilisin-like proprotein convertase family protein
LCRHYFSRLDTHSVNFYETFSYPYFIAMKFPHLPAFGLLVLAGSLAADAKPKTATPVKINPLLLHTEPYRYNGAVLTDQFRGSGFSAWNNHTFFSAAHVLFEAGAWADPPTWYPLANSDELDEATAIPSRGYYRWTDYAALAGANLPRQSAFGRDVILAFAFEKLISGKPAALNLKGKQDLRKNARSLITGYPADNVYLDQSIEGYFMHVTGPVVTPYLPFSGNALTTTLVSTGHGNSGGPVWTKDAKARWTASGVLVGGLPSESVVYTFSNDTNALLRSVTPVLLPQIDKPTVIGNVGSFSTFFPFYKTVAIPDGRHSWTNFRIPVKTFADESSVKKLALSLDIRTKHQGDLQVILQAPGGYQALVHNEEGAGKNNLIIISRDFSEAFAGIDPNGTWFLRVQDRLVGDIATLRSIVLEVAVDDATVSPSP